MIAPPAPPRPPLRVVIANPYFLPYGPGGAEFSMAEFCRLLAARGHMITVVTFDPTGQARDEDRDGYRIVWLPSPLGLHDGRVVDPVGFLGSSAAMRQLAEAIALHARSADLIHAQNSSTYQAGVLAGKRAMRPVVASVRDPSVLCPPGVCLMDDATLYPTPCAGLPALYRCSSAYLERTGVHLSVPRRAVHAYRLWRERERSRRWLRRCDAAIAISDGLEVEIARHVRLPKGRLTRVYNPPWVAPPPDAQREKELRLRYGLVAGKYFVVAGKKSLGKGTAVAAAAASRLSELHPEHVVAFFGPGPSVAPGPGVRDFPSIPVDDLVRLMRHAAGVVVPSLVFEGLHRGMVDAVACGVPIIASDSGGQREGILPGGNGILVPKGQVAPLAAALAEVAGWNPERRAKAACASKDLMEKRFCPERVTNALEAVYRDAHACRVGLPVAEAVWQ